MLRPSRLVDRFASCTVGLVAGMIAHNTRRELLELDEIVSLATKVV